MRPHLMPEHFQHGDLVGAGRATRKKKEASKNKYTCTECASNAWTKPETRLICGERDEEIKPELARGRAGGG